MIRYTFRSNINYFYLIIFQFMIFPLSMILLSFFRNINLNEDIEIITIIDISLSYFIAIFLIKTHIFYDDKIVIEYPLRFFKKYKTIFYKNVISVKFIKAPKGTSLLIICFNNKNKKRKTKFNISNKEKIKDLFNYLGEKEIRIKMYIWGQHKIYNGNNLEL